MNLSNLNSLIIPCGNEADWLAERRKRVQASDASKILAEGKAFKTYADKVSPPIVEDRLEKFKIKLRMEQPFRELYQDKFGGKVHEWPAYTIAVCKAHDWLGCTPDSLIEAPDRSGLGILQIKCWSEMDRRAWDEGPPLYVQVQTQVEMLATGLGWGAIGVMFGTQTIERFPVETNPEFVGVMLPLLRDFYTCLELRQPPAMDSSQGTTDALCRLHPNDDGSLVELPAGSDRLLARLARAEDLADRAIDRANGIKNELRAAIGGHTFGVTPEGRYVSWKSQDRAQAVVAASTFRVLRTHKTTPKELRKGVTLVKRQIDYKKHGRASFPPHVKRQLLARHPHCRWCGATLTVVTATIEHVVALAVGGSNDDSNLDLACADCNRKRGSDSTLPVKAFA